MAVSKNYARPCWALKLDIKKFFASVDHEILKGLLRKKIIDKDTLWLLDEIINRQKKKFKEILAIEKGKTLVSIGAWCLMNNHFHLIDYLGE